MTDNKYPPFQFRLGRVVREAEDNGKGWVRFAISVNRSYDQNDTDWVNVSAKADKKAGQRALHLRKGDRVVVEGSYKETDGREGKVFRDFTAMSLYRAVDVEVSEDDDEL